MQVFISGKSACSPRSELRMFQPPSHYGKLEQMQVLYITVFRDLYLYYTATYSTFIHTYIFTFAFCNIMSASQKFTDTLLHNAFKCDVWQNAACSIVFDTCPHNQVQLSRIWLAHFCVTCYHIIIIMISRSTTNWATKVNGWGIFHKMFVQFKI